MTAESNDTTSRKDKENESQLSSDSMMPPCTEQQHDNSTNTSGNSSSSHDSGNSTTNIRSIIGQGMISFTEIVNNNMIAFRYGTIATVVLLGAYGIANTPLFFRYKTVTDIPGEQIHFHS